MGLPFPKGRCADAAALVLEAGDGEPVPLQTRVLDRWSDGSARWVLLDFQATTNAAFHVGFERRAGPLSVRRADPPRADPPPPVVVELTDAAASVRTGGWRFLVGPDGRLTRTGAESDSPRQVAADIRIADAQGRALAIEDGRVTCEEQGPLRSVVLARAKVRVDRRRALDLEVRHHFHAGLPVVRVQVTLRNPHRAAHPGGFWELGDAGSVLLQDLSWLAAIPGGGPGAVACSPERGAPLRSYAAPLVLYQDSSGGEHWQSRTHLNRNRVVPLRFRGYRIEAGSERHEGLRATPVVQLGHGDTSIAVAHRWFWERFPKAITAEGGALRLGLLPREFGDLHELQGGEQITEDFVVSFGDDGIGDAPLDWVRDPLRPAADPDWYCAAEAMPYLVPESEDPHREYVALVNQAIDGPDAFQAKREIVDEYGWRNFGDLYADHETVKHTGPQPLVSHYNNQYDAIAGFALHFFRSGDLRWWTLLEDLARHVIDVDIYHTDEDKAAYNRGLFWHTAHHVDADAATHRTYPRSSGASGGPSPEHNYNTGLMLYYFLTGDVRAREAAIGLGQWVIDMDDGRKTPLRWISRAPTGVASATGSVDYHGPGRAPGNGIVALMNAFRLTGDRTFMAKAEELIRRCVHPEQDLPSLNLLDAERRWYYTVFLQAIGRYLDVKAERGEFDDMYAYARATLLHYARWMAEHEYPYLEKPEILEYPTETWAAQDMRKCEVLQVAAAHAADRAERERLLRRAEYFFDASVSTLSSMPTRRFTRPVVLLLTNGYARAWFRARELPRPPAADGPRRFEPFARFTPQKKIALRRLTTLLL